VSASPPSPWSSRTPRPATPDLLACRGRARPSPHAASSRNLPHICRTPLSEAFRHFSTERRRRLVNAARCRDMLRACRHTLQRLLGRQHGVVAVWQGVALGIDRATLVRFFVRHGFEALGGGIYVAPWSTESFARRCAIERARGSRARIVTAGAALTLSVSASASRQPSTSGRARTECPPGARASACTVAPGARAIASCACSGSPACRRSACFGMPRRRRARNAS
jgi:hypothetical protein